MLDGASAHSNGGANFYFNAGFGATTTDIAAPVSWRSATYNYQNPAAGKLWITSPVSFGAGNGGVYGAASSLVLTTPNQIADSLAGASTLTGLAYNGNLYVVGGALNYIWTVRGDSRIIVNNATWTNFAAPTFVTADTPDGPYLLSFRHNTSENDHRMYFKYGNILSNSTTRHTSSGLSWQHNPTGGTTTWFRPCLSIIKVGCRAGVELTIRAWVLQSSTYNGTSAPRLVVLGGLVQGIATDMVGDSWSGTSDVTWKQLTVTVNPTENGIVEAIVEGQGTAGSFYVDDVDSI
jgi:hypothetical protein